jgi:hypothetical protein
MQLDVYTQWRTLLTDLGALGTTLGSAIESGDVVASIATMVQLRRTRSALSRIDSSSVGEADESIVEELRGLLVRAHGAEAIMRAWRTRELPSDTTLLQTPLGIATIADTMLPEVWDYDADLVVLVGPGLERVAELLLDLGQRRIVMLGADDERATGVIHARSTDELLAALRTMVPVPPSQVVLRGAAGTAREELARLSEAVRAVLSDLRIHRNTVQAFSRAWIAQAMENLTVLASSPSVASVGDKLAGVPLVIVAPGPSLAKNVAQLRALDGRAIVLAFSHSLKPVLAAGVVPDLVLTVDPQDVRYHFANCETDNTWLVNAATAHPSLFKLPAQGYIGLSANCALDNWILAGLGEDVVVPGGGSVATTALSLGLRWKCDPIVFIGLDLSFPGGAYYVSTSSDGSARAEIDDTGTMRVQGWSDDFQRMKAGGGPQAVGERVIELPGWCGGTVPSSFMFSMFHRWFEERLAPGVPATVYNCTEGGARIEGMDHVPLARVLGELHHRHDVGGVLAEVQRELDVAHRAQALADRYREYLSAMRRCRKLALRGRAMIAQGQTAGLPRIEKALVSALRPLEFLSLIAQREVEVASDVAIRGGSEQGYLAASDRLLAALVRSIDEIRPQLVSAVGRLHGQIDGQQR